MQSLGQAVLKRWHLRPENGKRANIEIPGNRELQAEATVRGKGLETAVHCGDKLTHGDC